MSSDAFLSALAKAQALLAQGQAERALVRLRALLADDAELRALPAMIEGSSAVSPRGELEKWRVAAERSLEALRKGDPLHESLAVRIGRLMLFRGETAAARAIGRWLATHHPDGLESGLFLSELRAQVGDAAGALEALLAAARSHPDDPTLNLRIAQRLIGDGRVAEAFPYAKALKGKDSSPAAIVALARARIANGDPESAPALLRLAFTAKTRELIPVLRDLIAAGRSDLADGAADELLQRHSADSALWRLKADLREAGGDLAGAAAMLETALSHAPDRADFSRLAELRLALGDSKAAWRVYDLMREAYPREIAVSAVHARILEARGETAKAEALAAVVAGRVARTGTRAIDRQSVSLAGVVGAHGLGDFVYQVLALASLKRQFSDAHLTLIYNNERAYKDEVLSFCGEIDDLQDYGDGAIRMPIATKDHSFRQQMMFGQASLSPTLLARLERTAAFRTPPGEVDRLTAALVARGLAPDRWFVAMHYRSSASFSARMVGPRDVDPRTFHRLAAAVCEAGGQVVRLGHPGMDPMPAAPGYVDLADASITEQMFAVSKARFMIACDSGPTSFATAFKTPLFKTNAFTDDGAFYAGDLILPKNIVNWRGEVLSLGEVLADRVLFFKDLAQIGGGFRFADNTLEQLLHGLDLMLARTAAGGWRPEAPPDVTPPPEAIAWPSGVPRRAEVLDLARLFGAPIRPVNPEEVAR
jgi:putative glycosyltransferase (TIGR04372 family)